MKLIVGLGNPGAEYRSTRHNAGFMALERLAERHGLDGPKSKFHAAVVEGRIGNETVMLMQPMTFMNRSGLAVGDAVRFYKLPIEDVLVVVDDTALPVGSIRVRSSGGTGGHNGLADIQRVLGSNKYARLRVGIGEPKIGEHRIPLKDYVLGPFTDDQLDALPSALRKACDAIECWLASDVYETMNRFNERETTDTNSSGDTPKT
ncbi:MAG: aminoacyl-tRNA hydrolase [Phycisphaera sp.]|nr:aminoacyl-tRNA hydrolase [Phycisphaera sp.]